MFVISKTINHSLKDKSTHTDQSFLLIFHDAVNIVHIILENLRKTRKGSGKVSMSDSSVA